MRIGPVHPHRTESAHSDVRWFVLNPVPFNWRTADRVPQAVQWQLSPPDGARAHGSALLWFLESRRGALAGTLVRARAHQASVFPHRTGPAHRDVRTSGLSGRAQPSARPIDPLRLLSALRPVPVRSQRVRMMSASAAVGRQCNSMR